jgi:iron complex outermembrane receptor protein
MKTLISLLLLYSFTLYANDELANLLNDYKQESDLSHITKKESAGILEVYTRDELEKMQVKTLDDLLNILSGLYLVRTQGNLSLLTRPTAPKTPVNFVRLYINDHDLSSSSYGSAFLSWGELSMEYIDHVEIYKISSPIEFGNETTSLAIKLYTKDASRDSGSKLRFYMDQELSNGVDAYTSNILDNGISYFAYANINNINRDTYTQNYLGNDYKLNSDRNGHNIYLNLSSENWKVEAGSFSKKNGNFLGMGIHKTPSGGYIDSTHHYLHYTHNFLHDIKLQLSYDNISYNKLYVDENGIAVSNLPPINLYDLTYNDDIYGITLSKKYKEGKHSLLINTFYKYKHFSTDGHYTNNNTTNYSNSFSNALHLYSLAFEYNYNYNADTKLIASIQGDFYRYRNDVASQNEYIARIGLIKKYNDWRFKAFLTKSYIPTPFFELYNPDNIPYKSNPNLNNTQLHLATLNMLYTQGKSTYEFIIAYTTTYDLVVYNPLSPYGYINSTKPIDYLRYEFKYNYNFDINNKIMFDIFTGDNDKGVQKSPKYGAFIRLFNKYKKFDIYNELYYKSSYSAYGIYMDASFDYTLSIKYHYNKDLSVGLRGENLLNDGFEQAYDGLSYPVSVRDQKIWLNMEYLF